MLGWRAMAATAPDHDRGTPAIGAPKARAGVVVLLGAALAVGASAGCGPDRGPGSPGRAARDLYSALAARSFAVAREWMLEGPELRRAVERFGSIEAWASRLTKNGIIAHVEASDETVTGDRARVRLVVSFNDGTRRRDDLRLVRTGDRWRVDPASLPGGAAAAAPSALDR
jgi:hypothetical protein